MKPPVEMLKQDESKLQKTSALALLTYRSDRMMFNNMRIRRELVKLASSVALWLTFLLTYAIVARAQDPIPFVPTPAVVVEKMLELAEVKKSDLVYDLGCGDGRILIHAAKKYGARGVGVDLDPQRIEEARKNAQKEGVAHLLEFRAEDGTQTDISKATVVTLYMFKWFNNAIRPKLQNLRTGARVVAHDFDIDDWQPTRVVTLEPGRDGAGIERPHVLYLWKVGDNSARP